MSPDSAFNILGTFNDDYLYFYEPMLTMERTKAQVNFIESALKLTPGDAVLDVPCGHGRHLNELASRGYRCTGVDITPNFLEIARKDAKAKGLTVDYRVKDMRNLDYKDVFDAVYCYFTSFGYFEDDINRAVLHAMARALKPGGSFLMESINRDFIVKHGFPYIVQERDGNLMIDSNRFDPVESRIYSKRRIIRNDHDYSTDYFVRLYTPSEITLLLRQAGLKVTAFYGGVDKPYTINSNRMVVVADKR